MLYLNDNKENLNLKTQKEMFSFEASIVTDMHTPLQSFKKSEVHDMHQNSTQGQRTGVGMALLCHFWHAQPHALCNTSSINLALGPVCK